MKNNEGGKSIVNVTQGSSSRWFIPHDRGTVPQVSSSKVRWAYFSIAIEMKLTVNSNKFNEEGNYLPTTLE